MSNNTDHLLGRLTFATVKFDFSLKAMSPQSGHLLNLHSLSVCVFLFLAFGSCVYVEFEMWVYQRDRRQNCVGRIYTYIVRAVYKYSRIALAVYEYRMQYRNI